MTTGDDTTAWNAATTQALGLLQDLDRYELPPQRWEVIADALDEIALAYAARDVGGFRAALAELEPGPPVRVLRIGATVITGLPEPVLERRDRLVHTLTMTDEHPERVGRSGDLPAGPGWLQSTGMDSPPDWDGETLGDALGVLQSLVLWELVPQRWAQVATILDRIAAALAAHAADDLHDAVADLELSGPVRISMIGSIGESGIPEPVLERRNALVHALSSEPAPRTEAVRGDRPAQ